MTRGATRRKCASGQRGIPRAARGGGRGAPRERRDASDEKARSRTGRDPPPKMEVRFILRHPDGDGFGAGPSWRAGRTHVRGLLAALLLVLGSHLEWKVDVCGSGDGRARVATDGGGKVFFTIRRLFSRARAAEPQMRIFRWDSEPSLLSGFVSHSISLRSVFIIGKCRNRVKSSLVFLRLLRFSYR